MRAGESMAPPEFDLTDPRGGQHELPVMAVLPDGRFALRVARAYENARETWQIWHLAAPGETITGWREDGYLSDEELIAAQSNAVGPLADLDAMAAELEAAGQYAASRIVQRRAHERRIAAQTQ